MSQPWIVLKFGGTSVKSIERWETIESILKARVERGQRPLVVCSALSGLSNKLEAMLADVERGRSVDEALDEVDGMHEVLARDMGLDVREVVGEELAELRRLARGAVMIEEASPRLRARIMSMGELMSTKLGAAWLNKRGMRTSWQDAREMLRSQDSMHATTAPAMHYLSATCSYEHDAELEERLGALDTDVVLTQGFIAGDSHGDTVLLGRGGSDTSAAYFAARVGAERLEIWTDVPGMFTANPRDIRTARLLRHLDYPEAQELALMGAKVLHPRCIAPVAAHSIPLHLKCTQAPDMVGTIISKDAPRGAPQVKAVSARKGIVLISCTLDRALQNVGFLAQTAQCFERWNLSIDMVAASETNVTFSLDPKTNAIDKDVLAGLMGDLNEICDARRLGPGAAVSLVGERVRAILHELGPILERFEEHPVYMVSQAADDLNLTFIVEEDAADRLIGDLHSHLFRPGMPDPTFGPTWEVLFDSSHEPRVLLDWWTKRRDELLEVANGGTPCFVYDPNAVDRALDELSSLPLKQLLYSVKANPERALMSHLRSRGVGFQCGTPGELAIVKEVMGELDDRVWFSPHGASEGEYRDAFEAGAAVVVGSVHILEHAPELFRGKEIVLRFDPGRGASSHQYVRTAGRQNKFGIAPSDADRALAAVQAADAKVIGLHAHAGSGLRSTGTWRDIGLLLAGLAERFEEVKILNLGGGLAVPERVGQGEVDLEVVGEGLRKLTETHPWYELWMEPGRYLIARAGVLLAKVREVASKDGSSYVTVDAGINSLIRPALYGAWHEIVNLSRWGERLRIVADVVGPLTESADVLGHERQLPATLPGDVMLIANAGAYGHSLASHFNATEPAHEVVLPRRADQS